MNLYVEYDICWKGSRGILLLIALAVANGISPQTAEGSTAMTVVVYVAAFLIVYLQVVESHKLAKAFGKGFGWTLILIIFDRLGRIALGFGSTKYIGKR